MNIGTGRLLLGSLLLLLAGAAAGQADPWQDWRTLSSEHFNLHYPEELEPTARRALAIAERVHDRLSPRFHWTPRSRTEIVLMDQFDMANGMASPLPFNRIYLYLSPPDGLHTLADYDDWLELLITHEYTHTLHLDRAAGFSLGARKALGRNPLLFPALFNPTWLLEGLGTYEETDFEGGTGRGQSTLFEMMMRMELEEDFMPLGRASMDGIVDWPARQVPYLYGVWFYRFIGEEFGADRVPELVIEYSDNIVPFLVHRNFRQVLGGEGRWGPDRRALWARFRRWLAEELPSAGAVGTQAGERLTRHGYQTGPARSDGAGGVWYLRNDWRRQPALMHWRPDIGSREVTDLRSSARFDVHPEAGLVVAMPEVCRNRNLYYDLYHVDPDTGSRRRLTHCARYRDAVWAADGRGLIASRIVAGRSRLDRLSADGNRQETLWEGGRDVVLGRMDLSPDDEALVAAVWRAGDGWDLERFDLSSGRWSKLTDDAAIEGDPRFTLEGDAILFSSEHGGAFDIRRLDRESGRITTLTDVPGGAFSPAPGPAGELFYIGYTGDGYDLFRLPADEVRKDGIPPADTPSPERVTVIPAEGESRDYSPWNTLPPTTWLPTLQVTESIAEVGVAVSGMDALGVHAWSLNAGAEVTEGMAIGSASYTWADRFSVAVSRGYEYEEGDPDGDDVDELLRARAHDRVETRVTLPFLRQDWRFAALVGTAWTREHDHFLAPGEPVRQARQSGVAGMAFQFDSTRSFPRSVSVSDGRQVSWLSEYGELFGSDYSGWVHRLDWNEYLPLGGEHVLRLRLTEALGTENPRPFRVGGTASTTGEGGIFDQRHFRLRGYDTVERGRRARIAGAEWRFPITRPERAFVRPPLGLRQLSGRLFAEGGAAWMQGSSPESLRRGIGAELAADVNLFYRLNLRLILGVARGLDRGGEDQFYLGLSSPLF